VAVRSGQASTPELRVAWRGFSDNKFAHCLGTSKGKQAKRFNIPLKAKFEHGAHYGLTRMSALCIRGSTRQRATGGLL